MTATTREGLPAAVDTFYEVLHAVSQGSRAHVADLIPGIEQQLAEHREAVGKLRDLLNHAEGEQQRLEELLADAKRVLDPEHAPSIAGLRGKELARVAVQVLDESGRAQPIHYRDWYALVRAAGHHIGGKDPVASFLTSLTRGDGIEAVGARTGLYRLRRAAAA